MLEDEVTVLNLYKGVQIKADRYFDNVLQLEKLAVRRILNRIHNPPSKDEWDSDIVTAGTLHHFSRNEIIFPAGILQFPLFVPEAPFPVNYGAIGSVIGHEITHGYDSIGAKYDEVGNLRTWWDRHSRSMFVEKALCFVKQYDKKVEPTIKKNVDGNLTLEENIADNGGLRAAYEAYKMKCSREECTALPQMLSFSPDQLFFVAFGNIWCENVRTLARNYIMETDLHAPGRFRANVPLQNFPPFSEAFQCPLGSAMNPCEKCRVCSTETKQL